MLVKKTLVVFKSMLSLTHCSMSRNAMPYASSVDTQLTASFVLALSHGPSLLIADRIAEIIIIADVYTEQFNGNKPCSRTGS